MAQLFRDRSSNEDDGGEQSQGYVIYRDPNGARLFRILLLFVPVAVLATLVWLALGYNKPETVQSVPTTTVVQSANETITTTTFITPTLNYGAFDPALGALGPLAIGLLVLVVGALIEMAVIVWYGSFYLGDSRSAYPLSLPLGTVRVLVIIMVIFILIVFALLPSTWGDNNAVLFLFGLLSTVVGFYFGSSTSRGGGGGNNASPVARPVPSVQGVQPATGKQGESVKVTISGTGFNREIAKGAKVVFNPGDKIQVAPVTYVNPTTLTTQVTIASDAELVERDLTIQLPGAQEFKGKFTITAPVVPPVVPADQ